MVRVYLGKEIVFLSDVLWWMFIPKEIKVRSFGFEMEIVSKRYIGKIGFLGSSYL